MEKLHQPIKLEKFSNYRFRVVEDVLVFNCTIQAGIITDGMSLPFILAMIINPYTDGFRAALVHDYRYIVRNTTRLYADQEFRENLILSGFSNFTANLLYLGVRFFGKKYWPDA